MSHSNTVNEGAEVYDASGQRIGTVSSVSSNSFIVQAGTGRGETFTVPMSAVVKATARRVEVQMTTAQTASGTAQDTMTVPIVEEQLRAGVREVEAGTARIEKDVISEQQSIDVPVQREEVYVTQRAVNRPATQADLAAMDRDIEVPLTEQEVVTSKEAVVTGEVEIRKAAVTETQRVTDTVRREEVHVEDERDPHVHVEGDTRRPRR